MSQQLISRNADLKRLRDEGFDIEVRAGCLLLRDVPFVTAGKEIKRGILVSVLELAGDITNKPNDHVVMFVGELPCDKDGRPLDRLRCGDGKSIDGELTTQHSFSRKKDGGYVDYFEKMSAYVDIIVSHAHAIDPTATAQRFLPIATSVEDSVFEYVDTATSRAGIGVAAKKLELDRIAIVGVGGTGSYVLDLVAKTPVREIHLFDGDSFLTHNSFRAPGAASLEELRESPKKVERMEAIYSRLHRGIVPHDTFITTANVSELDSMQFVFLCIDASEDKRCIVERLESRDIPFIDVGMGVEDVDGSLRGTIRVTTSTPERRDHFRTRVSLSEGTRRDEYERNIQIADLNALNASLAVIKWKKLQGFYLDFEHENDSTYTIDTNILDSNDQL